MKLTARYLLYYQLYDLRIEMGSIFLISNNDWIFSKCEIGSLKQQIVENQC